MLLRSSSTPLLNSWLSNSSPESDALPRLTRVRSLCLATAFEDGPRRRVGSASDSKLRKSLRRIPAPNKTMRRRCFVEENGDDGCLVAPGGGDGGWGGGGVCRGGNGSGSDPQNPGSWRGSGDMEAYYKLMIEVNPGDPLLLANYAKFLNELKGDFAKAEEYYERAILADPVDGNLLSLYAELIWQTQRDYARAESYFHQAVEIDPNDRYVLASYARFLWDADDDNDNEETELKISQYELQTNNSPAAKYLQDVSPSPPLAAAT